MNKVVMLGTLAFCLTIPMIASAATWYSSTITLPRTGSWKTVTRQATRSFQQTKVLNNKYNVNARIVYAANNDALSDYETHGDTSDHDYGQAITHNTGVGDNIKAEFKTDLLNYNTTRSDLSWAP